MSSHWASAEYSHAYVIPFIAAWMVAQRIPHLNGASPRGAWQGTLVLAAALLLAAIGDLSTTYSLIQYSLLIAIGGLILAAAGWAGARQLAPAYLFLSFMVPLPFFFQVQLTAKLQLLSTAIGVFVLRTLSVPVFAEGNVIDLGTYQLQVAEACSGLRYLYPFLSLGFLVAYLYRGPFWQRAMLVVSTVPITLLMNGLRIGVIGLAVDRWGIDAARGVIHFLEGWVVFLICLAAAAGRSACPPSVGRPGRQAR